MKSPFFGQNTGANHPHHLFVHTGQIRSLLSDEPLFSRATLGAVLVGYLTKSFEFKGGVWLDNLRYHTFQDAALDARDIGTRAPKQPFLACFPFDIPVLEISGGRDA
jgi:hypothetical protein